MKVKIYGAGSIGNHLSQASRRIGLDVVVVDKDPRALTRMKNDIYPARYGSWDDAIVLKTLEEDPKGGFDVICVGTPPDHHIPLAIAALKEKPKVLQIEKPLCQPDKKLLDDFQRAVTQYPDTKIVVGYDHTISTAFQELSNLLLSGKLGTIETIDANFREHWQGIFLAHPWLNGPHDSYLGFWKRGGGASGECSHSLHMWLALAELAKFGKVVSCSAYMNMVDTKDVLYDSLTALTLQTDKNSIGRVVQDVVTHPAQKIARIQGSNGFIEWICNGSPKGDVVRYMFNNKDIEEQVIEKTRPDDFYRELLHIQGIIDGSIDYSTSPLRLELAITVMNILILSHENRNNSFKV